MPATRPPGSRDPIAGPEHGPESPFPIKLRGPVIKGFGRGSRELGIPTANIPPSTLPTTDPRLELGVYFGFVGLRLHPDTTQAADNSKLTLSSSAASTTTANTGHLSSSNDASSTHDDALPTSATTGIYPAVLSIGVNPYYNNPTPSIEIHILHHFKHYNFYHSPLNLFILGFIRPEYDYPGLKELVDDIKADCEVARRSLGRAAYEQYVGKEKSWLEDFEWWQGWKDEDVTKAEQEVLAGDKQQQQQQQQEKETGDREGESGEGANGKL